MSRLRLLVLLVPFVLSGCANTSGTAPVREKSYAANKAIPAAPPGHYRVQSGDTLYKIAFEFGLDVRALALWNDLPDPDYIRSGSLLRLHSVKPAAPLAGKSALETRAVKADAVLSAESDSAPIVWSWPSRGALMARYGEGLSKGLDIGGVRGDSILAAAAGKVVYAGSGLRGYGKLIIIRHDKALLSAYAHNTRLLVSEGQNVARGQPISEMGDTDTDRVKLHFQIREQGKPVDPLNYLPKQS